MKRKGSYALAFIVILLVTVTILFVNAKQKDKTVTSQFSTGSIYLYGEVHGDENVLSKEFELWKDYYTNQGMRHLFIELPYYSAECLNLWMKADNDEMLNKLFDETEGTAGHTPYALEFYKKIKQQCPETIFHGTDVGHQYNTTGTRYLSILNQFNSDKSVQRQLAEEAIEQGKKFYENEDPVYRENIMTQNFIREFDQLKNENVMGIYGTAHIYLEAMNITDEVPCMANQLKKRYGKNVYSEDISYLAADETPIRIDKIKVGTKTYEASYFGKVDISMFLKEYKYGEFWRLEDAYDDFKECEKTGEAVEYRKYPMRIKDGQVLVIDYTKTDGTVVRKYYCASGYMWNNLPATQAIIIK